MYIDQATTQQIEKEIKKIKGRKKLLSDLVTFDGVKSPIDQTYPQRFDFTQRTYYEVQLDPINYVLAPEINNYFRIGFKFSRSGWPAMVRNAVNYPLWHLTKNDNHPLVGCTYYDPEAKEDPTLAAVLIQAYDENPITLYLYISPPRSKDDEPETITLVVKHKDKFEYVHSFNYETHKYAWLTSWGDNFPFGFEVKVSSFKV